MANLNLYHTDDPSELELSSDLVSVQENTKHRNKVFEFDINLSGLDTPYAEESQRHKISLTAQTFNTQDSAAKMITRQIQDDSFNE